LGPSGKEGRGKGCGETALACFDATPGSRGRSARRPAQLNQRLDVGDVRGRPTGWAGEIPIDVGEGITAFSPIAVFSKGARKIELRFDVSAFLADPAQDGRREDD
jgi:hypothetical protein